MKICPSPVFKGSQVALKPLCIMYKVLWQMTVCLYIQSILDACLDKALWQMTVCLYIQSILDASLEW